MPPAILQAALRYKADLAAREAATMRDLAGHYLTLTRNLSGGIDKVAAQMAARRLAGLPVTAAQVYRDERYQTLLRQAYGEFSKYEDHAVGVIARDTATFARLGRVQALDLLDVLEPGVTAGFNRLSIGAIENIAAFTAPGSPLHALLADAWPQAIDQTTRALVQGVALGYGPRKIAKEMTQGMNGGLQRSLVISRTETLRAYRENSIATWKETGLVRGYQRVAAHDRRCCANCIALDGAFTASGVLVAFHPQDRCTLIPVLKGGDLHKWEYGPEWLEKQPESTQVSILGKGRQAAWKDGAFKIRDIPQVVPNSTWGPSLRARTLNELAPSWMPTRVVQPAKPQVMAKPVALKVDLPYTPAPLLLDEVARSVDFNVLTPNSRRVGLTNAEYESALIDRMKQYVEGKVPRIRVNESDVQFILDEGRFRTQFETGASGGTYNIKSRTMAEYKGLGAPSDLAPELRPVYGYYETPKSAAGNYGNVEFVLKPSAVPRTTVTLGDSLGPMQREAMAGTPANAITKHALGDSFSARQLYAGNMEESYIEAQIHGGVKMSDIEEIILHRTKDNQKEIVRAEKAAIKAGIKVRYAN